MNQTGFEITAKTFERDFDAQQQRPAEQQTTHSNARDSRQQMQQTLDLFTTDTRLLASVYNSIRMIFLGNMDS